MCWIALKTRLPTEILIYKVKSLSRYNGVCLQYLSYGNRSYYPAGFSTEEVYENTLKNKVSALIFKRLF